MTTSATAVRLRLPQDWIELDPRVPDLDGALRHAIRDTWGAELDGAVTPHLARLLGPLVVELRQLTAAADTLLVGMFCRTVPVDGTDTPLILTANVVLAVSPPGVDLDVARAEVPDGWICTPIDLPAGRSVVVTGETRISDPAWDSPVPSRARRYFIPVPGADRLAVLAFLTPNLDLAEAFIDVFDAVAQSVHFSD